MSSDMKTISRKTGKFVFGRKHILNRHLMKTLEEFHGEGSMGSSKGGIGNGKSGNSKGIHHGRIGIMRNR
jgi:hypothetical protein